MTFTNQYEKLKLSHTNIHLCNQLESDVSHLALAKRDEVREMEE